MSHYINSELNEILEPSLYEVRDEAYQALIKSTEIILHRDNWMNAEYGSSTIKKEVVDKLIACRENLHQHVLEALRNS